MFRVLFTLAARKGRHHTANTRTYSASAAAGAVAVARRAFILFPPAALGIYATVDDKRRRVAFAMSALPVRIGRDISCAVATVIDYRWCLKGVEDEEDINTVKAGCHQRGALRLLALCMANGGIYIKLGQHIGMLDYLLPEEYVLTMRTHLLDHCPVSPWDTVKKTITDELGAPPEVLFKEIDHEPIASASLAQVHVATDAQTDKKVAVKVQHPGLLETSHVDIAVIETVVRAVRFFTGVDYMWLVNETKENLPSELNFKIEAANAERCADNLNSKQSRVRGKVVVPKIYHSKTTSKVLTMEFIDGAKVVDKENLKRLNAPPAAVARLISETFNEMIFKFGDIHADPHAANMLIRATPNRESLRAAGGQRWQLVLLDHGLYRRLNDEFRLEYASLWRSLIFGNVEGIKKSATAMHAGDAVPLFAGLLTARPWHEISQQSSRGPDRLKLKGTPEEKESIQRYGMMYASDIGKLLARIPRELLLLLKTNDNLRAVDVELGAGVSTYLITARECTRALARHRASQYPGWRSYAVSVIEGLRLESRLFVLRALSVLSSMRNLSARWWWWWGQQTDVNEPPEPTAYL